MAKATSIKEALDFCEHSAIRNPGGAPVESLTHLKLYYMNPPIVEMDPEPLAELPNCEQLSLSTNLIDRIQPLQMGRLRVLSLARNNLTRLDNLESVSATLEQLWVSYNNINSLSGLDRCKQLKVITLMNNKIKKWEELQKLESLPLLAELALKGNPIQLEAKDECTYAKGVLNQLPLLKKLDGISATKWRQRIDEHHTSKLKALFDRIDLDRGGTITANEMSKALKNDEEMRRILGVQKGKEALLFAEMDEDGGGDISWDEFLLFFSQRLNDF